MYIAALVPAPSPGSLVEFFAQTSGPESFSFSDLLVSECAHMGVHMHMEVWGRRGALRSCSWSEWKDNQEWVSRWLMRVLFFVLFYEVSREGALAL